MIPEPVAIVAAIYTIISAVLLIGAAFMND